MKRLFAGVYEGRRVLVTGHSGFKGSWLSAWLELLGAKVAGYSLPAIEPQGHGSALNTKFDREWLADLRDLPALTAALAEFQPDIVFHLGAQALVRKSYIDPIETFQTNILGLVHLFEAIRAVDSVQIVINATTDKVYQDRHAANGYVESDPLGGHDPYSTSKACAEMVTECYRKSFFSGVGRRLPLLATARAGNVIGGGDWAEDRLVPDLVRASERGSTVLIRSPNAIRPWQHVLETVSGYLRLGQCLLENPGFEGSWNFGPRQGEEHSVSALIGMFQQHGLNVLVDCSPGPHPHEAEVLRLDCRKSESSLGWRSIWSTQEAVSRTADWYSAFQKRREVLTHRDIRDYVAAAASSEQPWTVQAQQA